MKNWSYNEEESNENLVVSIVCVSAFKGKYAKLL